MRMPWGRSGQWRSRLNTCRRSWPWPSRWARLLPLGSSLGRCALTGKYWHWNLFFCSTLFLLLIFLSPIHMFGFTMKSFILQLLCFMYLWGRIFILTFKWIAIVQTLLRESVLSLLNWNPFFADLGYNKYNMKKKKGKILCTLWI